VIREPGSGTRRGVADLVAREGLTLDDLKIFLVLPSNEAVREAVEAGAGATVISRHVVASAIAAGPLAEIPIAMPHREYAVVWHRPVRANKRPTRERSRESPGVIVAAKLSAFPPKVRITRLSADSGP
jgi:DNA-binding transcriptional LysR family regulator